MMISTYTTSRIGRSLIVGNLVCYTADLCLLGLTGDHGSVQQKLHDQLFPVQGHIPCLGTWRVPLPSLGCGQEIVPHFLGQSIGLCASDPCHLPSGCTHGTVYFCNNVAMFRLDLIAVWRDLFPFDGEVEK